jgi:hypothetical protein
MSEMLFVVTLMLILAGSAAWLLYDFTRIATEREEPSRTLSHERSPAWMRRVPPTDIAPMSPFVDHLASRHTRKHRMRAPLHSTLRRAS